MNLQMERLLESSKAGNFLTTVYECSSGGSQERDKLAMDLVALHNNGTVDIVTEFESLENGDSNGPDFFLTRRIFEKALPHLNAHVLPVMQCVRNLAHKAGQNMAATTILESFVEFCASEPSRTQEALKEIEKNPEEFSDMLPAIIASGMKIDIHTSITDVIRLSKHSNIRVRRSTIYSMAWIPWTESMNIPDSVFIALEETVLKEDDDEILANSLSSALSLMGKGEEYKPRALKIIEGALAKGNDITLYAASNVFSHHTDKLESPMVELLISHLKHINLEHKGTIKNIDFGISRLLAKDSVKAVQFLEDLLLMHPSKLSLGDFDCTAAEIRQNATYISKVATRWFQKGERILCDGVYEILEPHYGGDLSINMDSSEVKEINFVNMLFIARKAVGYLFLMPITVASLIVSLARNTQEDEVLDELCSLLYNPLLINYTGKLCEFLRKQADSEDGKVKDMINRALARIEEYLSALREIPVLPSLHPGQAQKESYQRYMSRIMAKSQKEAQKKSVFLNSISRSNILYGKKVIYHVHTLEGPPQRREMELVSRSVEMATPRMENIDPWGINYMLQVFRAERLIA